MSKDEMAEKRLWDELWGCVKYLEIPYETVRDMPVYIRKFWILKHNEANSERTNTGEKSNSVDGDAINAYAQLEQTKQQTPTDNTSGNNQV